ncbi:CK1 family protein kinase [Tritrichomonas foetus]|uniref:non-specific serine/threonine protein kinase n=1 Tax=Tritrichomonas foetus TaxID=1144522 RepID=A0A1J4KXS0_9EUKA|nr:CK1 family protein kinase [Tritrichomonas foetus]|eukprot:OHT16051.1 CK1 family protein kinase [Tritrichomonas foetus]
MTIYRISINFIQSTTFSSCCIQFCPIILMSVSKKQYSRNTLKPGEKVNNYIVVKLIGQGGYGDIYMVTDENDQQSKSTSSKKSGEKHKNSHKHKNKSKDAEPRNENNENVKTYAMKVELASCQITSLGIEQKILESLQNSIYFPKIYGHGFQTHFRYLVMDLYGQSLSNTRRKMLERHFSVSTTLRLGIFMMKCIEEFHKRGFVHCDIKPGNFLLHNNSPCPIVLIDYGLSKNFIDQNSGQPIKEKKNCGFVGTSKYASLQIHQGLDPCRRDDIISLCYSLAEMSEGKLPWRFTEDTDIHVVMKSKKTTPAQTVFSLFPSQIASIYNYAMNLKYDDVPNYNGIYKLFSDALEELNISEKDPFDWEKLSDQNSEENDQMSFKNYPKAEDTELFPPDFDRNMDLPDEFEEEEEGGCCLIC